MFKLTKYRNVLILSVFVGWKLNGGSLSNQRFQCIWIDAGIPSWLLYTSYSKEITNIVRFASVNCTFLTCISIVK